jgi:hypothetical protein
MPTYGFGSLDTVTLSNVSLVRRPPTPPGVVTKQDPRVRNLFEGTNGTTVSAANSGGASGDALDDIATVAAGTLAYDTANVIAGHGTSCMKVATAGTAGNSYAGWLPATTGQILGDWSQRFYFQIATMGAASTRIVAANAASGVIAHTLIANVARTITINDTGGSGVATTTTALTLGTWYRIELQVKASATVGQVTLQLFVGDSLTPLETLASPATMNTGTGLFGNIRYGISGTGVANAGPYYYDDAIACAGLVAIGPSVSAGGAVSADADVPLTATVDTTANLSRQGDVSVVTTAGVTATANLARQGDVSVATTATITPVAARATVGDVSVPITATITATATVSKTGDISVPITATITPAASRTANVDVTVPVTDTVTATASLSRA